MISQPYSSYNQLPQPQYSMPTSPVLPPQTFQPPLTTLPPIGIPSTECMGQARCFRGLVTEIRDGDTLEINGEAWRLALTSTPELGSTGSTEAKLFVESVCRIGTEAIVDEDGGQTEGSGDRSIGVVYCVDGIINKISLNELLLREGFATIDNRFCDESEFSLTPWAQQYGCIQQ